MTSQKLSCLLGLFGLKFFMGFLFPLDGRVEPIACLLFHLVIKMEVLAWNVFINHIEHGRQQYKHSPTRTHKKSQMLLRRFLDEYT